MAVYVDDIILATSTEVMLNKIKTNLHNAFQIVDKGPIHYCLGIQVERIGNRGSIQIHQSQYIDDLLNKNNMQDCKPYYTPLNAGQKLVKSDESSNQVDATEYQSLIGSIMFLAVSTRPDILHSISKLSQFNVSPSTDHLVAVKHLLRYLKQTSNLKLVYLKTNEPLHSFVDADWAGNVDDRKSYTGYSFFLAGGAISWESKKQPSVALSSTEAEYMALSQASKEAVYLRNLIMELGFPKYVSDPIHIYCDNTGAQQLVKNPVYHARTKHIDIRHHYVRQIYEESIIELKYISTEDMIADILTKNLYRPKHEKFVKGLGLSV